MDCKLIGPETKCICQCRYKSHLTDVKDVESVDSRRLPCRRCACRGFRFVFSNGPRQIKCKCKHDAEVHRPVAPNKCIRCPCPAYSSTYRCGCGETFDQHRLVVESKLERKAAGKPVGQDVPYQAMGGITGFCSLMDGHSRPDPSGIGDLYRSLEN